MPSTYWQLQSWQPLVQWLSSKILYPQEEPIPTMYESSHEKYGSNILDVISTGTSEGLKLAANVGAMLLVFVALIAMVNYFLGWVGEITHLNGVISNSSILPYDRFSLEMILGSIFSPIMWLIGVAKEDMMLVGQLLGIKLAASELCRLYSVGCIEKPRSPYAPNVSKIGDYVHLFAMWFCQLCLYWDTDRWDRISCS